MPLARRASVPHAAMLLILAAGALLYAFLGYHGALREYDGAAAAPVAGYVVASKHQDKVGRGRTQRTASLLELRLDGPPSAAPQTAQLAVTGRVYRRSATGDRWQARIVNGQPLFNPRLIGIESENRLLLVGLGLILGLAGGLVLRSALRNRG